MHFDMVISKIISAPIIFAFFRLKDNGVRVRPQKTQKKEKRESEREREREREGGKKRFINIHEKNKMFLWMPKLRKFGRARKMKDALSACREQHSSKY